MVESPEWQELQRELEALAGAAHAFNAYVFDIWDNLCCAAHGFDAAPREELAGFIHAAAARKSVTLVRGGKLDTAISQSSGHVYARSPVPGGRLEPAISQPSGHFYVRTYGSCYVLLLRFPGPFDHDKARQAASDALQRLEALTLRLPPPDGPGSDGSEAVGSA